MTNKPLERLLIVKERYLLLAKHDLIKAEFLYMLDVAKDWISLDPENLSTLSIKPVASTYVSTKLTQLMKAGLIDRRKDPSDKRKTQYRLRRSMFDKQVQDLGLNLIRGVVTSLDPVASITREFVYQDQLEILSEKPDEVSAIVFFPDKEAESTVKMTEQTPSEWKESVEKYITELKKEVDEIDEEIEVKSEEDKVSDDKKENAIYNISNTYVKTKVIDTEVTKVEESNVSTSPGENLSSLASVPPVTHTPGEDTPGEDQTKVIDTSISIAVSQKEDTKEKEVSTKEDIFYGWRHYAEITPDEWKAAREEGKLPGRERFQTLLLGAYLLGMYHRHKQEILLIPADFNGKYGRLSSAMLKFFTTAHEGDKLLGFKSALDWIKAFLKAPSESYIGKAGWPIQMAFSRDMYRQPPKEVGMKRNDTGNVIWDEEDRQKAQEKIRIGA